MITSMLDVIALGYEEKIGELLNVFLEPLRLHKYR